MAGSYLSCQPRDSVSLNVYLTAGIIARYVLVIFRCFRVQRVFLPTYDSTHHGSVDLRRAQAKDTIRRTVLVPATRVQPLKRAELGVR